MKICLNMIVKNESAVIQRCLRSAKKFLHYWVIADTGSSDGTQEMIREILKDIPGELHQRPWIDFAYNRNEVLALSQGKGDYIFLMDADEWLDYPPSFSLPRLTKDVYGMIYRSAGIEFQRALLLNNHLDWTWVGPIHEEPRCSKKATVGFLPGITSICTQEGSRSQDPEKFQKDLQMLLSALEKEPEEPRYVFYVAEAHLILGQNKEALERYQQRTLLGGSDQEIFWSLYQVARLQDILGKPSSLVVQSYSAAFEYRPSRVEPLFYLINHYMKEKCIYLAYLLAKEASEIQPPTDAHFVEKWMYEWGVLLQLAKSAYALKRFSDAKKLAKSCCRLLLYRQITEKRSLISFLMYSG